MTASPLSIARSMMSALLPRSVVEARTRWMRAVIPHCIEQLLLPHLAESDKAEFIQRMVNLLLLGASEHLSEREWSRLIVRLRHWTGTPQQGVTYGS